MGEYRFVIKGFTGADAEVVNLSGGKKVVNLSVAVNLSNGKTRWFKLAAWDKVATYLENVKKGDYLDLVVSPNEQTLFTKDGAKVTATTQYNISRVSVLISKDKKPYNGQNKTDNQKKESEPVKEAQSNPEPVEESDIGLDIDDLDGLSFDISEIPFE